MSGPYTVTFPAGVTSAMFNVSISNDDIFESNETFNLIIDVFSLPSNIAVGDISQAAVTILNDDGNKFIILCSLFTIHNIANNSSTCLLMHLFSHNFATIHFPFIW